MRETLSSAKYVNNLHKEFENSAYTTLDVHSVHALHLQKKRNFWVILKVTRLLLSCGESNVW